MLVGYIAERYPRHQQTVGSHQLGSCRDIEKYTGNDAPLGINMSSEDVIIKLVMVGIVTHRAIADIVFNTCRQFQYVGTNFADFSLQMYFITEIMIMVANHSRIVNIGEHRRVGDTGKEGVATSYRSTMCDIGIDIMLLQQKVTLVDMLSD